MKPCTLNTSVKSICSAVISTRQCIRRAIAHVGFHNDVNILSSYILIVVVTTFGKMISPVGSIANMKVYIAANIKSIEHPW